MSRRPGGPAWVRVEPHADAAARLQRRCKVRRPGCCRGGRGSAGCWTAQRRTGGRPITSYAPPSGLRFPQHLALRDRIADRVDQGFEVVAQTSVSAHLVRTPRFAPRAFLRAPRYLVESLRGHERAVHLSVRHDGTLDEREVLVVMVDPPGTRAGRRAGRGRLVLAAGALAAGLVAIIVGAHPVI